MAETPFNAILAAINESTNVMAGEILRIDGKVKEYEKLIQNPTLGLTPEQESQLLTALQDISGNFSSLATQLKAVGATELASLPAELATGIPEVTAKPVDSTATDVTIAAPADDPASQISDNLDS